MSKTMKLISFGISVAVAITGSYLLVQFPDAPFATVVAGAVVIAIIVVTQKIPQK